MQFKQIYALPSTPHFNAELKYGFRSEWFPDILEVKYDLAEIHEDAVATAGRLTSRLLASDCDSSGEYGAEVVILYFDGEPMALAGFGGENSTLDFLHVSDRARYADATAHVREHLDLSHMQKEVTYVDESQEVSLHALFGEHFDSMAETAIAAARETFGAAAEAMLGYDALELAPELSHMQFARAAKDTPVELARIRRMVFSVISEPPAAFLFKAGEFFALQGPLEDETARYMLKALPEYQRAWLYHLCDAPPANESGIARVA